MNNQEQIIRRLAEMVGFDLETQSWVIEPTCLYEMHSDLPMLLVELFSKEDAA